ELDGRLIALPDDVESARPWVEERQQAGTLTFDDADAVARAFPEWSGIVQSVAEHWRLRGWPEEAHALLQAAIEASPDDLGLRIAWIEQLTQQGDWERLEPLAEGLPDEGDTGLHRLWYLGRVAEGRSRPDDALKCYLAMADRDLAWCGPGMFYRTSGLLEAAGRSADALALWTRALAANPDWRQERWMRMVLATQLGDWDAVREDAALLELPVDPGRGPIDEIWGLVRLDVPGEDGPLFAMRTGPVTARIRSIRTPHQPERFGEVWVFDPGPVDTDEDGTKLFAARTRLAESGHVCFTVDGARLGDDVETELIAFADSQEASVLRYSSPEYAITDPDRGRSLPATYWKVAVPEASFDAAMWLAALDGLAAKTDGPLVWLELWAHLDDPQRLDEQRNTAQAWGMV
ncbi:MAG: tetratricopeptide repeat protein, partial [Myxococcota bacterium]